jgi:MFS superfamily sulfate permease-like transporter
MAAVLVGIAAVTLFDLDEEGVQVLGVLPQGVPGPGLPGVELAHLGALFSGALGIALVAVADTTVLSQSLAAHRDETVDPNQELRALGAANLAAGLFQGFAISSSASHTPVAVAAGARSQLTPWSAPSPSPCYWWPRRAPSATSPCRCWPRSSSPPPSA